MEYTAGKPSLFERLSSLFSREPEDREQLLALLHSACERNLVDADVLAMLEGALQVSEMQVGEVMVSRAQMDVLQLDEPIDKIAAFVVDSGHSRFPVVGADKDDVVGILLAKDLLRYFAGRASDLHAMLRPPVFVPETKRLDVLLREFRVSHNHMAIVVDEYGGVAGLVTIEDVLEQIVGDIEDEYDFDEISDNIRLDRAGHYRVKAATEIDDLNKAFGAAIDGDGVDTVGGLVIRHFGRLPRRGESMEIGGLRIQVLRADSRRVHALRVDRLPEPEGGDQ